MAEGRATYKIDVDARGAQASLDGVVKGALPGVEKLSGSLNAAASNLGGLGGQAGKTFGLVKQLGESFLQTGVFGLGIAAGVLAISHVVKKMDEAKERSEALAKSLTDAQARALGIVTQSYKDMGAELAALSGRSAEYRVEQATLAAQTAKIAADEAERRERAAGSAARRVDDSGPLGRIFGIQSDEQIKAQEEWTKASSEAAIARAQLTDATNDLRAAEASLFVSREKGTAPGKGGGGAAAREREVTASIVAQSNIEDEQDAAIKARREKYEADELDSLIAGTEAHAQAKIDAEERHGDVMKKVRDEARKADRENQKEMLALAKKTAKEKADAEKDALKSVSDAHRAHFQQYEDLAVSSMIAVSGMFFDALEQMAAGQKVMLDVQIARFIRSVGEQMIAIGIRGLAEAAIISLNPMTPGAGGPMAAASVLAIAGGAAMATGGAVAAGMFTRNAAGGGVSSGGGGGGSSIARPSRRREGVGGDGDGRSVTIVYNGGTFLGDSRQHERDRRRHMSNVFVPGVA